MSTLTNEIPKCLTKIGGIPLIQRQILSMSIAGLNEITIVTGYRSELIHTLGFPTRHNSQWSSTNMLQSLICADDLLSTEPFFITYSDIVVGPNIIRDLVSLDKDLAIAYDPNWRHLWQLRMTDPLEDAETFRLNSNSSVAEIGKSPKNLNEIEGQYMGLIRMTPKAWTVLKHNLSSLPQSVQRSIQITQLLQLTIEKKSIDIFAVPNTEPWIEIDRPRDVEVAEKVLL